MPSFLSRAVPARIAGCHTPQSMTSFMPVIWPLCTKHNLRCHCLTPWLVLRAGLTKSSALRGSGRDVNVDERIVAGQDLIAASVPQTLRVAYPELYALHDSSGAVKALLSAMACNAFPSVRDQHNFTRLNLATQQWVDSCLSVVRNVVSLQTFSSKVMLLPIHSRITGLRIVCWNQTLHHSLSDQRPSLDQRTSISVIPPSERL